MIKTQPKLVTTIIGDAMIDYALPIVNPKDLRYLFSGGVTSTKTTVTPGGATNVAVVLSSLRSSTAFIGKVGNDQCGKYIHRDLIKNGVKSKLAVSEKLPTGKVFNLILPNKQRFFLVDRGANSELTANDIDENICLNSNMVYFSGYSFQDNDTKCSVLNLVNFISHDVKLIFNPGAPNIAQDYKKDILNTIQKHVHIVILNEAEASALMGCSGMDAIHELLSLGIDNCAITMGAGGSIVASPSKILTIRPELMFNPVDTTGAGDAYAAGFIHGLQKRWSLEKIGEFASKIAATMVMIHGTRGNMF